MILWSRQSPCISIFGHKMAMKKQKCSQSAGKKTNTQTSSALTVIPQKAAVFFPNLCRNHCHSGMLMTAETWVNTSKKKM